MVNTPLVSRWGATFRPLLQYISPLRLCLVLILYTICVGIIQYNVFNGNENAHVGVPWYFRLSSILVCYLLIFAPIWMLQHVAEEFVAICDNNTGKLAELCRRLLVKFFVKQSFDELPSHVDQTKLPENQISTLFGKLAVFRKKHRFLTLSVCVVGLNLVYVMWGVLQEKLMTKNYGGDHFAEPQFLVFANRVGALMVAFSCILICGSAVSPSQEEEEEKTKQRQQSPAVKSPLCHYAYPAMSNILSSWCQYEALLFVTFPVQVIAKSCKIVPVMLMGKLLHGRSYHVYEYVTAGLISFGVIAFILSAPPEHSNAATFNSLSGLILICGYIALDSFTSTYQDNLFRAYQMSSLQMMLAVCGWATLFTLVPLVSDGTLVSALRFARDHPEFLFDASGSAICSGFGQILIYATIAEFGAVTFVIIMTIRQSLSILVSCLLFRHPVNAVGCLGLVVTFGAIFARIYIKRRQSSSKA